MKRSNPSDEFLTGLGEYLIPMRRFALCLCRDGHEADDLTQSTCERAISRWAQFQTGTRMESWLFSIMHSIWKNQIRKSQNRKRVYKEIAQGEHHFDGEKHVLGKISLTEVLSAMNGLNEDQQSALVLVCINGLSYAEAAEVLAVPQGTLESRVARGRIALGKLLDRHTADETKAPGKIIRIEESQSDVGTREYHESN